MEGTVMKKARSSRSTGKNSRKKKSSATGRPARRVAKARGKKTAPRKVARKPKRRATASSSARPAAGRAVWDEDARVRGLGPESGGQSGDTEDISMDEIADSESVEELLEEGQAFEAGVVSGVENAPDADEGEIRTREVPADDVPQEYLDED